MPSLGLLTPRPALAPERALLALPADDRVERAGLDRDAGSAEPGSRSTPPVGGRPVGGLASDPQGARRELQKHIEELRVTPVAEPSQKVLKISGRAKVDGLLAEQEAVRLQLVAGAGYARYYTVPETYWLDLR